LEQSHAQVQLRPAAFGGRTGSQGQSDRDPSTNGSPAGNKLLTLRRIVVHDYGAPPRSLVSRNSDPPGMVLRCQNGHSRWVLRAEAIEVPAMPPRPHDRTKALAEEIRRRHQGRGLFEEPDGVLGFAVDFAPPSPSK
jgi:hypothetical protein